MQLLLVPKTLYEGNDAPFGNAPSGHAVHRCVIREQAPLRSKAAKAKKQ